MPDSIKVPNFADRSDVDVLYERAAREMTPEEIREVDGKFKELYPDAHDIALKAFSEKMGVVDLVCPRAVVAGYQKFLLTPSLYGYNTEKDEIRSANMRYILPDGSLTSEQEEAITDIATNHNPNREERPSI